MPTFLGTLFVVICILLILVILLQKGRGGGLGAAFGGAGSSAFGTRTGDVFTWVTIVLTALFLLLAIFTSILHRPEKSAVKIQGFVPPAGTTIEQETTVRVVTEPRDGEVRYTLDGSDPTESSTRYSKVGVRVKPGQTLKVRAYKAGYDASEIQTAEYPKLVAPPPKPPTTQEAPTTMPATVPATQPAPQPATAPATQPATQPATVPATQPAPEPPAPKPATQPAPEPPAPKATTRPATPATTSAPVSLERR